MYVCLNTVADRWYVRGIVYKNSYEFHNGAKDLVMQFTSRLVADTPMRIQTGVPLEQTLTSWKRFGVLKDGQACLPYALTFQLPARNIERFRRHLHVHNASPSVR